MSSVGIARLVECHPIAPMMAVLNPLNRTLVIPDNGRMVHENQEFIVILSYTVSLKIP